MKLWLISQEANSDYDTYDSAVVAALDEADARTITPGANGWGRTWCNEPSQVTAEYIGDAAPGMERGVVLASFNAA